jgi:hypothetical protein
MTILWELKENLPSFYPVGLRAGFAIAASCSGMEMSPYYGAQGEGFIGHSFPLAADPDSETADRSCPNGQVTQRFAQNEETPWL